MQDALEDGLLAMGGDMGIDRLLLAYKSGNIPWNDGDIPLRWSPDPRFVLFPDELKESKSMKAIEKKQVFQFRTNTAFADVIRNCKLLARKGQDGTWITDELEVSFNELHCMGVAHCAEAWHEGKLVGGLYGIRMGHCFFGESMFSKHSNASKFAFIQYVKLLKQEGVQLIDCQVYTEHLESLGARMIPRTDFIQRISKG